MSLRAAVSSQLLGDTGDSNSERGFHMTPHRAAPLSSDLQRSFVMSQPPKGRMRNILTINTEKNISRDYQIGCSYLFVYSVFN